MIEIFHGDNAETHESFQAWRSANVDGFHMTERALGEFIIHYAQDKRENAEGRGCAHQGGSGNRYQEDKDSCYTKARKVCSDSFAELIAWATKNRFVARNCKHCDTKRFSFPTEDPIAGLGRNSVSCGIADGSTRHDI